jgi:hypothetical protein
LCIADGIPLVNIVRSERQVKILREIEKYASDPALTA